MFLFRWYHRRCPPGSAIVSGLRSSAREGFFLLSDFKKKSRETNPWMSVRRCQLGTKLSVELQKLGSKK